MPYYNIAGDQHCQSYQCPSCSSSRDEQGRLTDVSLTSCQCMGGVGGLGSAFVGAQEIEI